MEEDDFLYGKPQIELDEPVERDGSVERGLNTIQLREKDKGEEKKKDIFLHLD